MSTIKKTSHLRIAVIGNINKIISAKSSAGTEIWTYDFCSSLQERGVEVTLFSNVESSIPNCKNIHNVSMNIMSQNNYLDYYYENIKQILHFIEIQDDFDLVHVSLFTYEIFLALIKYIRIPICITVHSDFFSQNIFDQINNERNKKIHFCFVSKNQKRQVNCSKSSVIYNGINCSKFDKYLSKDVKKENYLFWIGRMCQNKGAHDAIKIAKQLDMRLILCGPIEDVSYYNSCIKPYLDNKIQYKGVLDLKEKIYFYEHAIATLVPIHGNEPFGLINIESMYCGTPIISYDRGAQKEIVENGKTGFIVNENNTEEVIECINKVQSIDGRYCKNFVKEKFDINIMIDSYISVYMELLENTRCEI